MAHCGICVFFVHSGQKILFVQSSPFLWEQLTYDVGKRNQQGRAVSKLCTNISYQGTSDQLCPGRFSETLIFPTNCKSFVGGYYWIGFLLEHVLLGGSHQLLQPAPYAIKQRKPLTTFLQHALLHNLFGLYFQSQLILCNQTQILPLGSGT